MGECGMGGEEVKCIINTRRKLLSIVGYYTHLCHYANSLKYVLDVVNSFNILQICIDKQSHFFTFPRKEIIVFFFRSKKFGEKINGKLQIVGYSIQFR